MAPAAFQSLIVAVGIAVDARRCARFPAAVSNLRIEEVDGDAMLRDWQYVHNVIIPSDALSLDEVRERAQRYLLEVAYLGDILVGCSTVRPPTSDASVATVIARVLGASVIETIVLASNVDGLRFAQVRGFVEVDRYLPPGDSVPFITLRLP
jgi:hypothetical protein